MTDTPVDHDRCSEDDLAQRGAYDHPTCAPLDLGAIHWSACIDAFEESIEARLADPAGWNLRVTARHIDTYEWLIGELTATETARVAEWRATVERIDAGRRRNDAIVDRTLAQLGSEPVAS